MKIRLNKEFYNREIVKEALNDFKDACNGKILNDDIEIELEPKDGIVNLNGEFCNYVLGLMKNKMMV